MTQMLDPARADLDAIAAVIDDVERGFNDNDADLLAEHVTDDVWAVGVNGAVVQGRQQLREVSQALLAGPLREQRARYVVDAVQFVRPDIALVRKLAWAVGPTGEDLDVDHTMVALYVFVRDGHRWRIAARQNTMRT